MSEAAFLKAAEDGDYETVNSLVGMVPINCMENGGYTAIYNAAYKGHLKIIQLLLTFGPDLTITTTVNGQTVSSRISRSYKHTQTKFLFPLSYAPPHL